MNPGELGKLPQRLQKHIMFTHGNERQLRVMSRQQRAAYLGKRAAAPEHHKLLARNVWGPLHGTGVPTMLPPKVIDTAGKPIIRTGGLLSLPPPLRHVLEDNWEQLKSGKVINPSPELIGYAKWHFGDDNMDDVVAVQSLATDVKQAGDTPRMAQALLRVAIALGAREMINEASGQIGAYFLDGHGGRQDPETMNSKKASLLPLTLQNGLPSLARAALRNGGGGKDLVKMAYGKGADSFVVRWLEGDQKDSHLLKHLSVDIAAGAGGAAVGVAIGEAFGLPKELSNMALNMLVPYAIAGLSTVPILRWFQSEDLSKSSDDIAHRNEAFGLLMKQLAWGFEADKNKWVSSMLQGAVDMQRIIPSDAESSRVVEQAKIRVEKLTEASRKTKGEMRIKPFINQLNLVEMAEQPDAGVRAIVEEIAPNDRTIPLSEQMNRMLDIMHIVKKIRKGHTQIGYPSQKDFRNVFRNLGIDRITAIKPLEKPDPISTLSLMLPAAHRLGTMGGAGITPTFNSSADASLFGGHGVNPGSIGFEIALANLYKRAETAVLASSHEHAALTQMQAAFADKKSPLNGLLTGFQFIGCEINPLGVLAGWATERNEETLSGGGMFKDVSPAFKNMLGTVRPPEAGNVDYALRLISATKHYEHFAEDLKAIYPGGINDINRSQRNLKFFRREMIDTLWHAFTENLKASLIDPNPLFTYSLLRMIQEDPDAGWIEKIDTMVSGSGVSGNFFDTPGRGVPTTIATLVKYMSDDKKLVNGMNIYGFEPGKTKDLVKTLRSTHIYKRLDDFIKHVYGFSHDRIKTFPHTTQTTEYNIFTDMFGRAHTYFDKTLSQVSDDELVQLNKVLISEMQYVCSNISMYARGVDSPEHEAYAFNIQKIAELAKLIDDEFATSERAGLVANRTQEINVSINGGTKEIKVKGITGLSSAMSALYGEACNAIPTGMMTVIR